MGTVLFIGRLIFGGYFIYAGCNHFTHAQALVAAMLKSSGLEPVNRLDAGKGRSRSTCAATEMPST